MNTRSLISRNKREGRYAGWHDKKHHRALKASEKWCFSIANKNRSEEMEKWWDEFFAMNN